MTFKKWLEQERACLEARYWVGDQDPETAWRTCTKKDWMRWLYTTLHLAPSCHCGVLGVPNADCPLRIFEQEARTSEKIRELVPFDTIRPALLKAGVDDWQVKPTSTVF